MRWEDYLSAMSPLNIELVLLSCTVFSLAKVNLGSGPINLR